MGEESPKPANSTPMGAVFLSYASQDAAAAQKICETLRPAGIEVWFDQSELRGGDAWDRQIRKQIHDCALFIPIISANSQARLEGYFRLEWKLAVERTHLMSDRVAFLVPVVIDDTGDAQADVPDRFREVQWTRLPGGDASPEFAKRIKRLLSPESLTTARLSTGATSHASATPMTIVQPSPLRRALPIAIAVLVLAALAYVLINKSWMSKPATLQATSNATSSIGTPSAAFNPPPHSIAVLPFVNMSGDKEQEYFSDGLTEELLDSLTRISELQVAARTSSFSFQGQHPDITTVAHKLNVGAVLEGSVRRSAHTVRITAQLVDGTTGFHLWSHSYDRDLGDVLALQTEIASAVTSALRVTLLGAVAEKVELGGTRNPAALDAYLKGSQAFRTYHEGTDLRTAVAAYTDAIQLDPMYALAYVGRSRALSELASWWIDDREAVEVYAEARADARRAVALAPNLGEAHLVLANSLDEQLDFTGASAEHERALALAPGSALVLRDYGLFSVLMGRTEQGLSASRRAVLLDPLNRAARLTLMDALINARRPKEAVSALHDALMLDRTLSADQWLRVDAWVAYYVAGDYESARAMCESNRQNSESHACLALVYHKIGRHTDAEAELEKFKAENPDDPVELASIYGQWGDTAKALSYLETALRIRYDALIYLKTWPLFDPLRNEPRFQAVMRELKFPD
jgi:TolB-like protein/Tfp pilus assembly protein PilF